MPSGVWPLPSMVAPSPRKSSGWRRAKAGRCGLPTSSSPSIMKRRFTGKVPVTSRTAAWAIACATTFALVSATPRAKSLPSATVGVNGSWRHSASGSTGWTS